MMSLLFFFIFFYFFLVGSFHSLLILMIVELMVLLCILLLPLHSLTFVFSITFLLFSVCLSSYGVSLIIKTYREVGSFYMMSVNLF